MNLSENRRKGKIHSSVYEDNVPLISKAEIMLQEKH